MKRLNFSIKDRKVLYCILSFVLVCVFSLTIAYAALSTLLDIDGNAYVTSADWNLYFNNPKVKIGSVNEDVPVITSPTTVTFFTTLKLPGDYYEFAIDIVNGGNVDAMIDNIEKIPELTDSQKKYLNYEVTYANGDLLSVKQLVTKKSLVRLKIKLEFRKDVSSDDLPSITENLNLSLKLDYTQSDSSSISVNNSGLNNIYSSGYTDEIGSIVKIGTEQFYVIGADENNVKLLSMYNLYVGGEYNGGLVPYGSAATSMQNSSMLGYLSGQSIRRGVTVFASDSQKGDNYSSYNGSIVEGYVNNYKNLLESKFGVEIVEARLLSYEEVTDPITFGCDPADDIMCYNTPYKWLCSSAYWLGSAYDSSYIWFVNSTGGFTKHEYSYTSGLGVRPVIVVSKDYFTEKDDSVISFTIEDGLYQARSGMTWAEWAESDFRMMVNNDEVNLSSNGKIIEYYFGNDSLKNVYAVSRNNNGSFTIVDPNTEIVANGQYFAAVEVIDVPTASSSLTYNGSSQTISFNNFDSNKIISGGTVSATNAGTYKATFTPRDGYIWNDATTAAKTVSWNINKASGSLSLSASSSTITGGIGKTATFTVTRSGDGKISVSTSNASVATAKVSGTTVTVTATGTGTATITVSVAAGTNHKAPSSKTYSVTITAYLIKSGSINTSMSGGVSAYAYVPSTSGSVEIAPVLATSSGTIQLSLTDDGNGTGGSYFAKNMIDLTNYNKMYITVSSASVDAKEKGGGAYVRFGATLTRENKYVVAAAKTIVSQNTDSITAKKTISLDISGLTGKHYLFINLYGAYDKTIKFTDWRLES